MSYPMKHACFWVSMRTMLGSDQTKARQLADRVARSMEGS
jgi:hypothetical protein